MPTSIPLSTFEQHIDEKILERGLKYYERGQVEEPDELETGLYEAIVHGSEDYTVRIRIQGDAITEHHCDCPYDHGDVCKHEVALIFQLQRDVLDLPVKAQGGKRSKKPKGSTPRKPTVAEQVDRALAGISQEELVKYVRERCMENASFRQHFLITCAPEAITVEHRDHLKRIRSELRSVAGRGGYYGWDDTYAAGAVLEDVVDQAKKLLSKGHPERALPMITAVIEGGSEAIERADDSNGDIGGGITSAYELLAEIAQDELDEDFRKTLLSETQRLLADKRIVEYDLNDDLLPIAAHLVRNETEAAPLMASLKQAAKEHYGGSTAREALIAMTRRFRGNEAAVAMEESFMDHTEIRERAIETAINAKDWTRARALAEAGKQVMRDGQPATFEHYWTPHLLRIAKGTKDKAETQRLARVLLLDGREDKMKLFELLRTLIATSEWPAYVDQLLKDLSSGKRGHDHHLTAKICAAEGRWAAVLTIVQQEGWGTHTYHSVLDDHEKELGKHFPLAVATLLAERAELLASRSGANGDDYDKAVRMLRRIRKLGEAQLADNITADWHVRLKRRPRLMQALGKG